MLEVSGDWSGSAVAARNPPTAQVEGWASGGDIAIVVMNPHSTARQFKFETAVGPSVTAFMATLEPRSFNSFLVPAGSVMGNGEQ